MTLSPFPSDHLKVELFYAGAWQDVTADVDTVQSSGVSIERRRGQPAVCRLTLRNTADKYSPRNPTSALYGLVGRNTPIRVKVRPVAAGTVYTRFWGEVSAWPRRWTRKGTPYVTIECAGIRRRLGQGAAPVLSSSRRALGAITASVWGYWPCEEPAGASSFAAVLAGARPATWVGTPTLASDDAWPGSAPLPVLGSASLRMVPAAHAVTGETQVQGFLYVPTGTVVGTKLLEVRYSASGTVRSAVVKYAAAGALQLQLYDVDGVELANNVIAYGIEGDRFWCSLELSNSGANVARTLATFELGGVALAGSDTVVSASVGRVTSFTVNPDRASLGDLSTGHWRIMSDVTGFGTLFGALGGWVGEAARDRVSRLCTENGVPILVDGVASPNELMGRQGIDTLLALLDEAETVGQGLLFERPDAEGLRYRAAVNLLGQAPKVTIPYTDNLLRPFEPVDDDALTRNKVTVQRAGGTSATVEQTTGPMSTLAPSAGGVGIYDEDVTLSLAGDDQTREHAAWRVARGTLDEERFPVMGLDLADSWWLAGGPGGSTLTAAVMTVDLGDRLDVADGPGAAPDDIRGLVVGISEEIGLVRGEDQGIRHVLGFELEPERPYEAAKYSTTGPARYGTAGSTLAEDLDTTETAITVNVGRVAWAHDDGDYQIAVGGEVMTVTAAPAAAAGQQTLTVVRSVNGVVKTHLTLAAVELYDGDRYAF